MLLSDVPAPAYPVYVAKTPLAKRYSKREHHFCPLLRPDPCLPYYFGPTCEFGLDHGRVSRWRAGDDVIAVCGKAVLYVGLAQCGDGAAVQRVDDSSRGTARREQTHPRTEFIAGYA